MAGFLKRRKNARQVAIVTDYDELIKDYTSEELENIKERFLMSDEWQLIKGYLQRQVMVRKDALNEYVSDNSLPHNTRVTEIWLLNQLIENISDVFVKPKKG